MYLCVVVCVFVNCVCKVQHEHDRGACMWSLHTRCCAPYSDDTLVPTMFSFTDAATPMDTDLPSSTAIPPTDTQHDAPPIAALKQDAPPPPQQEQQEQQQGQQPPQSRDSSPSVDATEQDLGVLDEATMWQQGRPASRITHTSSPTPSGREDAEERARQLEGIPAATDTQYNNDNKNNNNNNNTNDDMFAEEDDIFAATPDAPRPTAAAKRGLQDAYDDAEGYYNFQVGEVMDDRYEVFANLGRGVFSSVLRARDVKRMTSAEDQWEVAIKVCDGLWGCWLGTG